MSSTSHGLNHLSRGSCLQYKYKNSYLAQVDIFHQCLYLIVIFVYFTPHILFSNNQIIFRIIRIALSIYLLMKFRRNTSRGIHVAYCFSAVILVSTMINNCSIYSALGALSFGFSAVALIHFGRDGIKNCIHIKELVFCFDLYALFNLISIFMFPGGIIYNDLAGQAIYLIGDKFMTSYVSLIWIALCFILHKREPSIFHFVQAVVSLMATSLVLTIMGGTTGILCVVLFAIFMFTNSVIELKFISLLRLLLGVAVITLILVFFQNILLNNSLYRTVVVDILGKSPDLTNRFIIYSSIDQVISKKLFLGIGFDTSTIQNLTGFDNVQNGILQVLTQYGTVGIVLFALIIYFINKESNKDDPVYHITLYCYFAFMLAALVEIPLQEWFFLLLGLFPYKSVCTTDKNDGGSRCFRQCVT